MPKSRVRKKTVYVPPTDVRPSPTRKRKPSSRALPIVALALLLAGVAWLVVYYLSQGAYPVKSISAGNLAVGFGMLVAGLGVLTQWR
ncbi:MAG: septation inhibitor protein [Pseudonocardiales bacterium]|nr:MAG: septation inhibitor protein [Pseudonocardiales bacterium]